MATNKKRKPIIEDRAKVINKSPKERYVCYNDIIGRGSYKIVYRGYDTHTGMEVAWNLIHFDALTEVEKASIVSEVKLLENLSSQNDYILQFHNVWIDNGDMVVITELAMSGTLKDYILKIGNVKLRVIKKWCKQILNGLQFLHSKDIVHRDLKCSNIFVNSNTGNIVIGDLGLAKKLAPKLHSVIGTPEYMAPEMFEDTYTEKVDIYAFGMCLLEMVTKSTPYSECPGVGSVYKKIADNIPPASLATIMTPTVKNLIEWCIKTSPESRPTATELLKCLFFVGNDDLDMVVVKPIHQGLINKPIQGDLGDDDSDNDQMYSTKSMKNVKDTSSHAILEYENTV